MIGELRAIALWLFRGTGRFTFPVFLGVEIFALFSRGTIWQGEWAWTVDWANGATILAGPLLAGVVAYDVQRNFRKDSRLFYRGTRRGIWFPLEIAISNWVCGAAAHAATLAIALAATASTRPTGRVPLAPLALGPTVLATFAAVGLFLGAFIPRLISAPIALALAFSLTVAGANGSIPSVFRVGGSTGSLVGLSYNPRVLSMTAILLTALLILLMLVVVGRDLVKTSAARPAWVTVGIVAVLGAGISYVSLTSEGDYRFQYIGKAPTYVCQGSQPQVCLAQGTTRQLQPLTKEMHRQAKVISSLGVRLPDKYVQEVPGVRPSANHGILTFSTDQVNTDRTDVNLVADYISSPAACIEYFGELPPREALNARVLLADVIRARLGLPLMFGYDPAEEKWIQSRTVEADAWVVETFNSLRDCRLEEINLPF